MAGTGVRAELGRTQNRGETGSTRAALQQQGREACLCQLKKMDESLCKLPGPWGQSRKGNTEGQLSFASHMN